IGGGPLLDTRDPLPEEAWRWTRQGSGEARIRIGFRAGIPGILDGETLDPVALIGRLNRLGGRLGVGRGYHLGDTVLGIKGRIAFEAPAAEFLLVAHAELEKLVLTEEQRFWKDHLGEVYGRRLHQGLFHDPFLRDVEAFLASSQERVTGTVRLHLADGRVTVEGLESPFGMLQASAARYGERADPALKPGAAAAMARILAEPARLHRLAAEAGGETDA
ncbi:MAG: argininosuccinate synthase, partial [Planctomycetota bacterium]